MLTFPPILSILCAKAEQAVAKATYDVGRNAMPTSRRTLLKNTAATAAGLSPDWTRARAEAETIRIGVIYDLSAPFAAGGSLASPVGAQIALDLLNEHGGVGGKYT